jgi:flagellar assembly protein FliH
MIEQLLKKSDELSNAVIRLEQKLETQAKECETRITQTQENAYKTGYNEGYNKAKEELENKINEHLSKLIESIHKVEEVYKEYQSKAEGIEKELVGVAIDIAQEVIAKELSNHSKEIALNLTKELINDIKEATQIEVKLNPIDYDYVKEHLNLEKITIRPDNAISPGGVVIISDAGNIEAEVHERFNAIKSHLLKDKNEK